MVQASDAASVKWGDASASTPWDVEIPERFIHLFVFKFREIWIFQLVMLGTFVAQIDVDL